MYFFLNNFIRTYVYRVLADLDVLNDEYLPGSTFKKNKVLYERYIKPVEDAQARTNQIADTREAELESIKANGLYEDPDGNLRPKDLGAKF